VRGVKVVPIYEYKCSQCGHELESLQKITDAPLTDCPVCGKSTLQKLTSAAGFQLKGTGWYATDYKNNSVTPSSKENTASPAATTDAKPADSKKNTESKTKEAAAD
jgi:putative FmdB family regulatory protein